jgi:uracil-DNA glycosylase
LGVTVPRQPDLGYLARQGVMFLNTSLTVELNKSGSHTKDIFGKAGLWDKFIGFLVEEVINFYNSGLVYVSLGNNAHVAAKAIVPFIHWGFQVEHPAAAAHKERSWNHENIFTKVNKILKNNNNEQIQWVYGKDNIGDAIEQNTGSTGIRGKILKE